MTHLREENYLPTSEPTAAPNGDHENYHHGLNNAEVGALLVFSGLIVASCLMFRYLPVSDTYGGEFGG